MTTLTVTAKGQVTFRREILNHLGIGPGDRVELDLLPNGKVELAAARAKRTFRDNYGFLRDKSNGVVLTIEEIKKATEEAWSDEDRKGR